MKKLFCMLWCAWSFSVHAQFGVKGGLNFANVRNASSINSGNSTGFMAGVFMAPPSSGVISSVTEFIFSRQGYSFASGDKTGNVKLDYIILPQFMGINFTKYVQLQLGAQMAYLISASADSTTSSNSSGTYSNMMEYYNRFDYGFGAGLELRPFKGLVVGGRWNISLGKMYKEMATGQPPSFFSVDARNNLVQMYVGWRFGNKSTN